MFPSLIIDKMLSMINFKKYIYSPSNTLYVKDGIELYIKLYLIKYPDRKNKRQNVTFQNQLYKYCMRN